MRLLTVILFLLVSLPLKAADSPAPPPPELPDLEQSAPASTDTANALEPKVTIYKRGKDTVEEYRMNGKLYMMKITPEKGKPYYLIDNRGDGRWSRTESLDSGLRVPQWVIKEF